MISSSVSRRKLFWNLQIGGWTALIPVFFAVSLIALPSPAAAAFNAVVRQALGFVLTLGLSRIYRQWHWNTFTLWRHGTLALLLSLAATLIDLTLTQVLSDFLQLDVRPLMLQSMQLAGSIGRATLYGGWSALYLSLHFSFELRDRDQRLNQAEIAARDAELQALRAQLNPHFLFNALNSILAEAEDNPAVRAITLNLSELLRFSLRQRDHFGPLGAEIEAIENYLEIERARFEDRLDWQLVASPEAREAILPTTLLLPLVENAIKYGLQTSPDRLLLRIGAESRDGAVDAYVENSGHWIEPDPTSTRSTGIGLNNLRRRLALLCGPAARVDISFPQGFVRVALHVPLTGKLA